MAEAIWCCPICKAPLHQQQRSLVCKEGHLFDLARSGYVNLLPVSRKRSKQPGNNAQMVNARRLFLHKGYYQPLCDQLCSVITALAPDTGGTLLDAGCGEGYYTGHVTHALAESGKSISVCGVDIAKCAVDAAAKSCKAAQFAVGSVFHLPVADESCDLLMSLFAPYCGTEFQRILRPHGKMVLVIPGAQHLMGLKQVLYDAPYENEVQDYALSGFTFLGAVHVEETIRISDPEDIQNLFAMTPYYYKTGKQEQARLMQQSALETPISFEILQYEKEV
jgi:23S rRNA (guanine745-N1)-methyltransferase